MNLNTVIGVALCVTAYLAFMIPVAIVGTKRRLDMAHQELRMQRQGTYAAWASQHQSIIRQRRVAVTTLAGTFVAFVLLLMLSNPFPIAGTLAKAAIGLFVMLLPVAEWTDRRLHRKLMESN
jgi:hypothetical protein